MSNIIDKNLFKQIFGHTFIKLADKLINTKNKEENQMILNNIRKNKDKIYKETSDGYEYVIQSSNKRNDLVDATNYKSNRVILIGENSQKLLTTLCN